MADQALLDQLRSQMEAVGPEGDASSLRGRAKGKRSRSGSRKELDLSSPDDALSKITALVNVSDRSEKSLRERLGREGFGQVAIDEAVERAKSYGFIDDMRYASVLIRSRLSQGKGISGVERELATHGIDIESVPGWPEEFGASADAELDRALAFLEKRPPRSKNLRDGAYRKLVGKGFSSQVAASAARIWAEAMP